MPNEEVEVSVETVEPTPEVTEEAVNAVEDEPVADSESSIEPEIAVETEAVDEATIEVPAEESPEEESEVVAVTEPTTVLESEATEPKPDSSAVKSEAPVVDAVAKAPAKSKAAPAVPTYQEAFPPLGGNVVNGGTSVKKANAWSANQIRKIRPSFTTQVFCFRFKN